MKKKPAPRTWTTREGSVLLISKMGDDHLLNAYRMLKRKGYIGPRTLSFYLFCEPPSADGASLAFELEFNAICDAPVHPAVDWLKEEIERRGLEVG